MRSKIMAAILASVFAGACSMADNVVVATPEPTLSIILPQERGEDSAHPVGTDRHGLRAVRADGGLLQEIEEGFPDVIFWDVVASISPGLASVQGSMRYSGQRGTISLTIRLWKGAEPLLNETASGSQGNPLYPPLPFGLYSYSLAHEVNFPESLTCGITNHGSGRFQAFVDIPLPNTLQSAAREDFDNASLPDCPPNDIGSDNSSSGGTVHWGSVCWVLDWYDVWGEYSYTEVVKCWAIAYTTGEDALEWEI